MDNGAFEERAPKRQKFSPEPAEVQHEASAGVPIPEAPVTSVTDTEMQSSSLTDPETLLSVADHVAEKEHKVGITVFVGEAKTRLRGLVKKRYADFLVNEILPGGRVLRLRNMKVGTERERGREGEGGSEVKQEDEDEKVGEVAVVSDGTLTIHDRDNDRPEVMQALLPGKSRNIEPNGTLVPAASTQDAADPGTISETDKAALLSNLSSSAVTQLLDLYASIISNPKKKAKDHPVVRTEFTSDRTLRAHIHQHIRRIFSSKIESSTTHDGVLVLQASTPRSGPRLSRTKNNSVTGSGGGGGRDGRSWSERGGEYTHFTLYKENKDTMETISLLARFLKLNTKELSFAGTKDRRAVTVQRVSVRRVDAQRLAALNRTLRMCAVGDFVYEKREVGLGGLEGNEFCVTVRECDIVGAQGVNVDVEEKVAMITNHLTAAMERLHSTGFLNYFGLQRFGTFATRSDTIGLKLLNGDYEAACDAILEYQNSAVADTLPINGDSSTSISLVGREDRARAEAIAHFRQTKNVHESLGMMPRRFSAETAVIRHLGRSPKDYLGAILGIQHGMRSMYIHAYQSMVWNKAVSERWRLFGARVVEGDLVLVREHHDKQGQIEEEQVDADGEIVVTAEGEDRAKVADEVFERARVLTKEEVEGGQYTVWDVVMPQPGFDVLYPANASGQFYKSFMGSEEGGGLDPHEMKRKQRDFSLPGAYRKVLARIGRDWQVDVRRYEGDEEQFVVTDLERIVAESGGEGSARNGAEGEAGNAHMQGRKIAAVLKFQLGTSQYATMALRELSRGGVSEYKPEFSGGR